jgi:CO/xanthine dehydrogenase Mo-binding subunit
LLTFRLAPTELQAQRLPGSLARAPQLDAWLRIGSDGTVTLLPGKVELGQGIRTALAQIAADELDVDLERIDVLSADTDASPNEGYTAGSMSIEQSGAAVRQAAAEARHLLLERAASRLGVPAAELAVEDGTVRARSGDVETTYWQLVDGELLEHRATGDVETKDPAQYRWVGKPVARLDLPGKVFGEESYVHDLRLPGMVHGRVVRPPHYGAHLAAHDAAPVRAMPGVLAVVRDGSFLGVVAEREEQAVTAAERLAAAARWEGDVDLPDRRNLAAALRAMPSREAVVHERNGGADATEADAADGRRRLRATYVKPYLAHASMAPSCAVAQEKDGRLTVWSHTQGVFPLRSALAGVLGRSEESIRVVHRDGAGCYGHNGADDVACDAALLALAVAGRPVRVQWSRADEFRWEPFGSAMLVELSGALDQRGRVVEWEHRLWSCPHSTRPGRQPTLLAGWHKANPVPPARPFNIPLPSGGADRNAVPLYTFPKARVVEHFISDMPVRVSALRSLGAFANVFAIESFVDELAHAAGADPVAFRLRHLDDARARAVIEAAAKAAGWGEEDRSEKTDDAPARGRGFAFARYKNHAAYVALVADVEVTEAGEVRVRRVTAATDAGLVVNPDGVRNQIEGGVVQAASWTLIEEVTFDSQRGITSRDWRSYPILGFEQVPEVEVVLLDRPSEPSLGAGEAAQGPTAAAIANAVADATGVRVRELPMRPERVAPPVPESDG